MKSTTRYFVVCVLLFTPFLVDACPMCQGGATEEYAAAYKTTTALLVLIPLITGAVIFRWVHRSFK
ncbi:MAG: hypothetical protein GY816_02500 [Cytophagales bacterium]|nr:hypothetical protein [Cytophagales bacterium]